MKEIELIITARAEVPDDFDENQQFVIGSNDGDLAVLTTLINTSRRTSFLRLAVTELTAKYCTVTP